MSMNKMKKQAIHAASQCTFKFELSLGGEVVCVQDGFLKMLREGEVSVDALQVTGLCNRLVGNTGWDRVVVSCGNAPAKRVEHLNVLM